MTTFLFDGSSLLYRAAYQHGAEADWGNLAVATMMQLVRTPLFTYLPDRAYLVWEGGRSQRRTQLLPEYKQTPSRRAKTEEDIVGFKRCQQAVTRLLRKLAVRVVAVPGKEADDVIGYLATNLDGKKVVVSADRDFYQLVQHGVHVFDPGKDLYLSEVTFGEVVEGLAPEQYLLYRAMTGDSSDNIKGVPKVGEVTARQVLKETAAVSLRGLHKRVSCDEPIPGIKQQSRVTSIRESMDVIARNLELMDLTKETFTHSDTEIITATVEKQVAVDESVIADMSESGYTMPSRHPETWLLPFYRLT